MDYLLRSIHVKRIPRMTYSLRLEGLQRELAAAQALYDGYPCRSYYQAVDRLTRTIIRFKRLGRVSNREHILLLERIFQ